jgi:hypothetical protein
VGWKRKSVCGITSALNRSQRRKEDLGKMVIASRRDRYKAMMETQGIKTVQNRIFSHSILMKIKTAKGNLISKIRTNPSKKAYFIRGVSKISDYFGQQYPGAPPNPLTLRVP